MKSKLQWLDSGGVASPAGFRASGIHSGIKKKAGAMDLAMLVSDKPAAAAGVFTLNLVKAAPVLFCKRRLAGKKKIRAVVINSGCANACTGARGLSDAGRTAALERFLDYVGSHDRVWAATRADIARHWRAQFPPPANIVHKW